MMWIGVAGGALECLACYGLSECIYAWAGISFPYGVVVANVLGSLIIGFASVLLWQHLVNEWLHGVIIIGFLGGGTIVASFSLDMTVMVQENFIVNTLLYMGLSVVLCLLATALDWWLGSLAR